MLDPHQKRIALRNTITTIHAYLYRFPGQPLWFVLPGFPFKFPIRTLMGYRSSSRMVVDAADYFAMLYLAKMIRAIEHVYPPGLKVAIVCDVEGFQALEDVEDRHVTQYHQELRLMRDALGLGRQIRFIRYSDLHPYESYENYQQRTYGSVSEYVDISLQRRIGLYEYHRKQLQYLRDVPARHVEDMLLTRREGLKKGLKSVAKKTAKQHAWQQDTWRHIISQYFPDHVRLSVHAQPTHARKMSLYLSDPTTNPFAPVPWQGIPLRILFPRRPPIDTIINHLEMPDLLTTFPLATLSIDRLAMGLPCYIIDTLNPQHMQLYQNLLDGLERVRRKRAK